MGSRPLIVAITGSSGSGKTTAASLFKDTATDIIHEDRYFWVCRGSGMWSD